MSPVPVLVHQSTKPCRQPAGNKRCQQSRSGNPIVGRQLAVEIRYRRPDDEYPGYARLREIIAPDLQRLPPSRNSLKSSTNQGQEMREPAQVTLHRRTRFRRDRRHQFRRFSGIGQGCAGRSSPRACCGRMARRAWDCRIQAATGAYRSDLPVTRPCDGTSRFSWPRSDRLAAVLSGGCQRLVP